MHWSQYYCPMNKTAQSHTSSLQVADEVLTPYRRWFEGSLWLRLRGLEEKKRTEAVPQVALR